MRRRAVGTATAALCAALVLLCGVGGGGGGGGGWGPRGVSAYLYGLNIFSFNVTTGSPAPSWNLTVPYMMAFFGPNILTSSPDHRLTLSVRVPPDADPSGCAALNASSVDKFGRLYAGDTAVVLFRNGCTFAKRVAAFAAIGVKLVIFYACSPDPPFYCSQGPFETITSQSGMNIPSIQTDWLSGQNIINQLAVAYGAGAEMTFHAFGTYNGTGGGVYAPDQAALRAAYVANPTLRWSGDNAAGTYDWATLVSATPLDPCRYRLLGTWCERGRIVSVNVWTPGYWEGYVELKYRIRIRINQFTFSLTRAMCLSSLSAVCLMHRPVCFH